MRKSDADLFAEYWSNRSTELRNQLVARNLKLAYQALERFWTSRFESDREDLRQVALLGLIKAVEGFDVCRGASFSTYSSCLIRGEIQHYMRDKMPMMRGSRSIHRMLKEYKITEVDAAKLNSRLQNILWLGMRVYPDCENPMMLEETLAAPEIGEWESIESVYQEIERLPEPLRELARLKSRSLSHKEISQRLGIHSMTVTRRLTRACGLLRKQLI
jgi:RNA polymerase sigma factor (sigma-70 family)